MGIAHSLRKESPRYHLPSIWNYPAQGQSRSRVHSKTFLDDSLQVGHLLRLLEGDWIRELVCFFLLGDFVAELLTTH